MIGYRHGWVTSMFTQLPPGALIAISGPRSEKPTLVPTWRRPPTAMKPGQFAGVLTAWPAVLPAEATTTTPAAVSRVIAFWYAALHAPLLPRLMLSTLAGVALAGRPRPASSPAL